MNARQTFWAAAITTVAVAAMSFVASAGKASGSNVAQTVGLESKMKAAVRTSGCSNNPGPYITLEGQIHVAALNARLIFRNNEKGTHEHTEDVTVDFSLLSDQVIQFAKQPPLGGVGGNPWIYLQLTNEHGDAITAKTLNCSTWQRTRTSSTTGQAIQAASGSDTS